MHVSIIVVPSDVLPTLSDSNILLQECNKRIVIRMIGRKDKIDFLDGIAWEVYEETPHYIELKDIKEFLYEKYADYDMASLEAAFGPYALKDSVRYLAEELTEATAGFTIAYPNRDFYIGKPMDLYELMTDFLIDWDEDKTTMTEYEAEDVASIRENYEEVFYAALEVKSYWEGQEFEEVFGRFSDYGIANAI